MAHLRAYIGPCAAYGWTGGPEFKTRIKEMPNGRERRNADWAECRHAFSMSFLNIRKDQYAEIKQMHLVCRGMLHTFLYRDHLDYEADDELIGTGDGTTDLFQLVKISTIDGVSYRRGVYAIPDDETITVTLDDTPTTAFTLDRDRGTLLFDSPPGNGAIIRWSGVFDVWVRFNQDRLPFSIDNLNAQNGQVDLMEVPPPELVES